MFDACWQGPVGGIESGHVYSDSGQPWACAAGLIASEGGATITTLDGGS